MNQDRASTITNSQLKEGYKQTEVGIIPEDWSEKVFGNLYMTPSRNGIYKSKEFQGRGTRIVNMGEMFGYEFISNQEMSRIILTNREKDLNLLKDGDLLFGRRSVVPAGAGKCSIIVSPQEEITFESSIIRVRLDLSQVYPLFYYYFFASNVGQAVMSKIVAGTNIKGIRGSELRELFVVLPPTKAEQEAIACTLSDIDALIESLDRLLTKKRQIKQGAMQELLRSKKGWEHKTIEEIADKNKRWSFTGGPFGSNLQSSDYRDDGVRIIQLQNIGDGEFLDDHKIYTSQEKADELLSCNIYPGDIILSKMGDPVARACIIPPNHERYLMCSDGIRLAVDQNSFDTYFIYILINSPNFRVSAENASTGSTRKRIGLTDLRKLQLFCPPRSEQIEIANILSDMDAEIDSISAKLTKTRQLKQGMMHELLTGRIRLVSNS